MSKIQRFGLFSSNGTGHKSTQTNSLPVNYSRQPSVASADTVKCETTDEVLVSSTMARGLVAAPMSPAVDAALKPSVFDTNVRLAKRQRTSRSPESVGSVPSSGDRSSRFSYSADTLASVNTGTDWREDRHATKRNRRNILSDDDSDENGGDESCISDSSSSNLASSNTAQYANDLEPSHQSSGGNDHQSAANIWAEYERHRRSYQKYMKLAGEAFEEMNRAARHLSQTTSLQRTPQSPSTSPALSKHNDYDSQSTSSVVSAKESTQNQSLPMAPVQSQSLTRRHANTELIHPMRDQISTKRTSTHEKYKVPLSSDASKKEAGFDVDPTAIKSNDRATRPFQFNTSLYSAFQRKPRAALICQFKNADYPMAVAYGMDGSVQIWDPHQQQRKQMLMTSALGMDFPEHMAQVTPSLLAAVAGVRSTADSLGGQGRLVFLSQHDATRQSNEWLGDAQHWDSPPHKGPLSVVEGMAGQSTHGRGMLLTGGLRDHKVFVWSLEMNGSKVAAATTTQQLRTHHSSRIGALCFEQNRGYVLSGSDSGRVGMNDAETGKDLGGHMPQGRPSNAVGNIVACPANPNLMMISYAATDRQLRIVDLRQRLAFVYPVLVLGQHRERTQSRYIRPTWHPDSGLIFYPIHQGSSDTSSDGTVAIWDTRYAGCSETAPQISQLHKQAVWSVGFSKNTMVSVGGDYNIGFTTFRI
ncbi:hypothetical protein COEREDRAFT_85418 [Coemansia reversa NRRL 1564]|uniref:WD40 repeat-like protein n=1 Tax=Coemansia reversa (strain ATCC 12441 / NRRL 1564) TaxID=763665 RepID=A0A2G5BHG4_COERN|nr:hypothetical protein COEREDRAFT_85418 [Coemansia reversa NRRL 1564]|eukprot:PIA18458.1 hypothetical protein COEREDRAFT_85418 [Coemansia reversa NRRL 1564]